MADYVNNYAEDEGDGIFEKQLIKAGNDQCSVRWHIELQKTIMV